jgi:hypothetical protein
MIAMIGPSIASYEHTLNTLRYADRVKELGVAEDCVEDDCAEEDSEEEVEDHETSGLAQLQSLNDGECSVDWYNFQESVAQMQILEEEVVEAHANMLEGMKHWSRQDAALLALTNQVDYDQDGELMKFSDCLISCCPCSLCPATGRNDLRETGGVGSACLQNQSFQARICCLIFLERSLTLLERKFLFFFLIKN